MIPLPFQLPNIYTYLLNVSYTDKYYKNFGFIV